MPNIRRNSLFQNLAALVFFFLLYTFGIVSVQAQSNTKGTENLAHTNKDNSSQWVATWAAASDSPGPKLGVQTLRQIMKISVGGDAVRVRISNQYGDTALRIDAATLAHHDHAGAIVPSSLHRLRVSGRDQFVVPVGESILTDAVDLPVHSLQELVVSLFFAQETGVSTVHTVGLQTAYISFGDDQTTAQTPRIDAKDDSRYFVTDIEVHTNDRVRGLVLLGDSITDGVGSTMDGNTRWPDQLAERLQKQTAFQHISVINAGISGNRILNDGLDPFLGPSTLKRFDRDVINKSKVKWVLLLQGINDIAGSGLFSDTAQQVTADQIIDGMKTLISKAHQRQIKIIGATLLPRAGATGPLASTPKSEEMRKQINAWIRGQNEFDAIVDFERVLRDPDHPERQLPAFNSGDFRHPNAAGYRAMAEAIDLKIFQ